MNDVTINRSTRTRTVRLSVRPGGAVVLTAPLRMPLPLIERFIATHTEWIHRAREKMQLLKPLPRSGRRAYLADKEAARALVHERLEHWNAYYGFSYGRVAIKHTKTLWGSCSRRGNLNFSYALLHVPRALADYVIVHELCHLQEPNHSRAFWKLVGSALPNYAALRKELRTYLLR